jgi:tetratricopeptide (TPR) repeat protein
MTIHQEPGELYYKGYAAFDRGDFRAAVTLAGQCLSIVAAKSYWRFGALGLRCLAANYLGDFSSVEQDACRLLDEASGADKVWFDGLAWLNLGLSAHQQGKSEAAQQAFAKSSGCYQAYEIRPKQPLSWTFIVKFYAALTHWAANGDIHPLTELAEELKNQSKQDDEINHLEQAITLILSFSNGKDVHAKALAAVEQGVSRAFLAIILLD